MTARPEHLYQLGRFLIVVGGLTVGFACYQLWGTGLVEWQAQRQLEADLAAQIQAQAGTGVGAGDGAGTGAGVDNGPRPWAERDLATDIGAAAGTPPVVMGRAGTAEVALGYLPGAPLQLLATPRPLAVPSTPAPVEGEVLGRLEIPSLGVSKAVVHGVERDTLRQAPGHYPTSALPGQGGNVAIAGHRTTYGAPFHDLDRLVPGDTISIETPAGTYTYTVQGHDGPDGTVGHQIVDPSAVEVIADQGDDRLTLTACHPKYSARQRIVVSALLVDGPGSAAPGLTSFPTTASPLAPTTTGGELVGEGAIGGDELAAGVDAAGLAAEEAAEMADTLGWQRSELDPTVLWATVVALVAHAGWVGGRLWRPRPAYLLTAPVAVVPLFLFFAHLDRLLPAL